MKVRCVCCKKEIDSDDLKVFSSVGVCPDCYEVADMVMKRGVLELKRLMTLMEEAVRVSLIEGRLSLHNDHKTSPSKKQVLSTVVTLVEALDRRKASETFRKVMDDGRVHR
jgi:hypothetical protein